jgi:hypothetical protein
VDFASVKRRLYERERVDLKSEKRRGDERGRMDPLSELQIAFQGAELCSDSWLPGFE